MSDMNTIDNPQSETIVVMTPNERKLLLMQKAEEQARKKRVKSEMPLATLTSIHTREDLQSCVCYHCGYVFYRKKDEEDCNCPKCQTKHHFEPLAEELKRLQADEKLNGIVARIKPKSKDTHVNDAKNQASLQMGSDEYEAYVEDLKDNDPQKKDDAFHAELEQLNEDKVVEPVADAGQQDVTKTPQAELIKRRMIQFASKIKIHEDVVAELAAEAARTDVVWDDMADDKVTANNPVINDAAVQDDEYKSRLGSYLGFGY